MKILKRWIRNLRWILNSPPTSLRGDTYFYCDYCGEQGDWNQVGVIGFCFRCLKKTMDKVLKEEK